MPGVIATANRVNDFVMKFANVNGTGSQAIEIAVNRLHEIAFMEPDGKFLDRAGRPGTVDIGELHHEIVHPIGSGNHAGMMW